MGHRRGTSEPVKIGLVLGAGGLAGLAFHAGTLIALEADLGWDPRDADVIVGSSAGSIAAAALRAGVTTDDLAAWASVVAPSAAGRAGRDVLDAMEGQGVGWSAPRWKLPGPKLLARACRGDLRIASAAMALLPHGVFDGARALRQVGALLPDWPTERLWITAVRTSDARRVVLGKDVLASVGDAVAASCAIPALFRPVRIDGDHYIDGGAHSPTNADVLTSAGVDLAVVLSPMSGAAGERGRSPRHLLRAMSSRRLQHECEELERAGIPTHVLEPDAETIGLMGVNALDRARVPSIVTASFLHAGQQIARDQGLVEALYRPRHLRTLPAHGESVREAS